MRPLQTNWDSIMAHWSRRAEESVQRLRIALQKREAGNIQEWDWRNHCRETTRRDLRRDFECGEEWFEEESETNVQQVSTGG